MRQGCPTLDTGATWALDDEFHGITKVGQFCARRASIEISAAVRGTVCF